MIESLRQKCARAILGPDLDHAVIFFRRSHHLLPFPEIMGKRLFNVNVLAGLTRPDRRERMPMVGQGDHDGIDGLVIHHLAQVGISGDLLAAILEWLCLASQMCRVHIAERGYLEAGNFPYPRNELMPAPS